MQTNLENSIAKIIYLLIAHYQKKIKSENKDYILNEIRTKQLKDSVITIVLIGKDTWSRKWVDWEIYSSLHPYKER
ncbi:TIR domain-containing protein [Paenibacillus nicotianae]|uniref:TIR domain-containing protein n=1 Tax=Paenibacillus nicotianae TaxID=1526551 RepID=A0ABW4UQT8_9BACL